MGGAGGSGAKDGLGEEWAVAVAALGGRAAAARLAGRDLERRYAEPHRRYHTGTHVRAVLSEAAWLADAVPLTVPERALLTLAACAHDVVYNARPGDDERASAQWARGALAESGLDDDVARRVAQLILATLAHEAPAGDQVAAALLDADLAILGAEAAVYDGYAQAVRAEYASVPDELWRTGRTRVLGALLGRGSIFVTTAGAGRWESAARANVRRELSGLLDT